MNYGRIPLFPGGCGQNGCVQVPLFGDHCGCGGDGWRSSCGENCQTVRVCNPACPGEYADVELCVDSCGNLRVCVHRQPEDCCRRGRRHR